MGGTFETAGGIPATSIAKWDGSNWSALGGGITTWNFTHGDVSAIAVNDSDVYVAGWFTTAGGVSVNNIARWDGSSWSDVGGGVSGEIVDQGGNRNYALAVSGSDVYIGGGFIQAGGTSAIRIARWSSGQWTSVGQSATNGKGADHHLKSIVVSGNDLYVGGGFTTINGIIANHIAKWDGNNWSALGSGVNSEVTSIAISGGDVYVAGSFSRAGETDVQRIGRWDGSNWYDLGRFGDILFETILAIAVNGSDVYVGGNFTVVGGGVVVNRIARWDGSSWSALGSGVNDLVSAIAISGDYIYIGGSFTIAGGVSADRIARWDGSSWSALGSGVNDWVGAITISGDDVYAGGTFTTAGGLPANRIARWDGNNWSALGSGVNDWVRVITISGSDIFAGGGFTVAGGISANRIARWDGSSWSAMGSGVNSWVEAITINGSNIFVGGNFTIAGGKPSSRIAGYSISEPTAQPSGLTFSSITDSSYTVSFTPAMGSPDGYIAIRRMSASPTFTPVDGTAYAIGETVSDGIVAHTGKSTSFNEIDLTAGTTYYYDIYSYNGSSVLTDYLADSPLEGSQSTPATEPIAQPTDLTFSNPAISSFTVSFTAPAGTPNDGYIAIRKTWNSPSFIPVDGSTYSIEQTVGDGIVAYIGDSTTFTQTGLTGETIYYYDIFSYNGIGLFINYLTDSPLEGSKSTVALEPTTQPASLAFSDVTSSSFILSFLETSGPPDGYIAVRKAGASPTGLPEDGTGYTMKETLGDGIIAYVGSHTTFADTGLTQGEHYYAIFSYNGSGQSSNYLTVNPLEGSRATLITEPVAQPTNLVFSNVTDTSFTLAFSQANGSPTGYMIIRKSGSSTTFTAQDGIVYTIGQIVGDGIVVSIGGSTTFNETGLASETTYYYDIFSYNGSGASINYLNTLPLQGSQSTLMTEPVAQPTNLIFSNIKTYSFTVSFTAASGNPDGYIAIRGIGASPPSVPADGTTYSASQTVGDDVVAYIGAATTFNEIDLQPNTIYFYNIYSYNGSSELTNYLHLSPLQGNQLTASDTAAPVISAVSANPDPANLNTDITISADIEDASSMQSVLLYYMKGNEVSFQNSTEMSFQGNNFTGIIPANYVTGSGVLYLIYAQDEHDNESRSDGCCPVIIPSGSVSTGSTSGSAYQSGFPQGEWRMISVPLDLDEKNVSTVLSDFGNPGNTTWKLYDGSESDMSFTASFILGKAFWLKQLLGEKKQVTLGSGRTAGNENRKIILLPGWNQIANPFTFPVDWTLDTDAADNVNIRGPIKWDGEQYVGIGQTDGNPAPFNELKSWDGYFVYNVSDTSQILTMNPSGSITAGKNTKKTLTTSILPQPVRSGWKINFRAKSGNFKDSFNYVGVAEDASEFEDRYDLPELPVIGSYVSLYFDHEYEDGTHYPFTIDYKAPGAEGAQWTMYVKTNVNNGMNLLEWTANNFPENYVMAVFDFSNNRTVITENGYYKFNNSYEDFPVRLKIFAGTEEFVEQALEEEKSKLPEKFHLSQNYPNPFNPLTSIRFELVRQSSVTLAIYNILGERVKMLIVDQIYDTGIHEVTWDGTDNGEKSVSSGIYIYQIRLKGFVKSKKMILVR